MCRMLSVSSNRFLSSFSDIEVQIMGYIFVFNRFCILHNTVKHATFFSFFFRYSQRSS